MLISILYHRGMCNIIKGKIYWEEEVDPKLKSAAQVNMSCYCAGLEVICGGKVLVHYCKSRTFHKAFQFVPSPQCTKLKCIVKFLASAL